MPSSIKKVLISQINDSRNHLNDKFNVAEIVASSINTFIKRK